MSLRICTVAIGSSAGGIEALLKLLVGLPADFCLSLIVVQHLPDRIDSRLAEVFGARLSFAVKEAQDKESIAAGTLYFAPPGYHLSVEADRSFSLSREEPVNHARPSIDLLFESAADAFGAELMGILLTGANEDGAQGLRKIAEAGGRTVVQSPAQAQVATMPEAALRLFTPDHILPLQGIRQLLVDLDKAGC